MPGSGSATPLFGSAALNWFSWFQYIADASGRFLLSVATEPAQPIHRLCCAGGMGEVYRAR
jgi:hypothetical protein